MGSGGLLGELGVVEGSSCALPADWRLRVLEASLERESGQRYAVESVDLYALPATEQHAAITAVMRQCGDFPVVLVDGSAACVGGIDMAAVRAAVAERIGSGRTAGVQPSEGDVR